MAIDPNGPDTLAAQSGLAGGLLKPLDGSEYDEFDPKTVDLNSLPDSDYHAIRPNNVPDYEEIQLAALGPITPKLARAIGLDFSGVLGGAQRRIEQLRAQDVPPPTGEADAPDLQPSPLMQDALDNPTADVLTPGQVAEGAEAVRAQAVAEGMDKPVDIPTEGPRQGMLDDFRAVGAQGDAKIPDEGRVLSTIQAISKEYSKEITEATRGEITAKETEETARLLGVTPNRLAKTIMGRQRGGVIQMEGAGLAETMYAARTLLVNETKKLDELADKARTGSEQDALAFRSQLEFVAQIQAQIKGSQTEIARALGQFKIPVRGGQAGDEMRGQDISTLLDQFGGADDIRNLADAYSRGGSTADRLAIVRAGSKFKKFNDAFYEAWINILLSSPVTHVKNMAGNMLTIGAHVAETYAAAGYGSVRRAFGGEGGVYMGEANAQMFALVMSVQEAWGAGGKAFMTGETPILGSKIDGMRGQRPGNAISAEAFDMQGVLGQTVDFLGNTINVPSRALEFEDTFYKVLAQRMSLYQQAYRSGKQNGLEGDALSNHIAEFVFDPPASALKEADTHAKYITLQSDLDQAGKALSQTRKIPMMRYFMPFFKTPYNAFKYAMVERSPLGLFYGESKRAIDRGKAPGASPQDKAAADMAKTRIALGTTSMMTIAGLAAAGKITGAGPADPELRASLRRAGWQPYSIKIGDTYYNYQGAEPFASTIGVAADAAELMMSSALDGDEASQIAMAAVGALAHNMTNKTFMQGFSSLVGALNDPARYGEGMVDSYIRSIVPRVVAQTEKQVDPIVRAAQTKIELLQSQVPGWSSSLPAKRNFWGHKIMLSPSLGPDMLSPIYTSTIAPNPAANDKDAKRAFAMDKIFIDLRFGPGRHPDVYSSEISLNGKEIERFHILAGKNSLEFLEAATKTKSFRKMYNAYIKTGDVAAREEAVLMLRSAVTDARDLARYQLLQDEEVGPSIEQKIKEAQANEIELNKRLQGYVR